MIPRSAAVRIWFEARPCDLRLITFAAELPQCAPPSLSATRGGGNGRGARVALVKKRSGDPAPFANLTVISSFTKIYSVHSNAMACNGNKRQPVILGGASIASGIEIITTIVGRHEPRKSRIISAVSPAAIAPSRSTATTEATTNTD